MQPASAELIRSSMVVENVNKDPRGVCIKGFPFHRESLPFYSTTGPGCIVAFAIRRKMKWIGVVSRDVWTCEAMRVSADEFERLVREAIAEIPDALRGYLDDVVVDVEPAPRAEDLAGLEIDDPTELLGLYHGTPLTERSVEAGMQLPDRVTIYQRNIELVCATPREIVEQIRTTVLHEIGHYFGLDEDDLFDVGYD